MGSKTVKIIVIVIGLYLIWVSAKSLWDLKKASGRVDQARLEMAKARQENQSLKQKLREATSAAFVEKEAREKLNLQKPGEIVILLDSQPLVVSQQSSESGQRQLENWEKWWRLFFR